MFDEQGELVEDLPDLAGPPGTAPRQPLPIALRRPCSTSRLNGSWLLQIRPLVAAFPFSEVRGPMRIEVGPSSLRISGDVYVRRSGLVGPVVTQPFVPVRPGGDEDLPDDAAADDGGEAEDPGGIVSPTIRWYPQLPKNEYSWYFRSTGVTYSGGTLSFSFVRHLWDRTTQEFVSTDTGRMTLRCEQPLIESIFRPVTMQGTATIGSRRYVLTATKTSTFYRGCRVEVDAMTGRRWPVSALTAGGVTSTFQNVYASAGWDTPTTLDEVGVPDDTSLTNAELQTLLSTHRGAATGDQWRLWLLVGSTQGTLFGIMFDEDAVPREGAVGFADATLGSGSNIEAVARNRPLDEVPAAFLRTLVHEAGHAFNLFHPKHDVHVPGIGTEIMNQTGDVMGFATAANPYPGNATFGFSQHDRMSLIHSPDPQVRPGWKGFGWGHGSLSSGLPQPTDAEGLVNQDDATGLALELRLPDEVYVGEYVVAELVLTNTGDEAREVSTRLNLAEGDLRLLHALPGGDVEQVRDVVLACGPPQTAVLNPGESITSRLQVFFTSEGVTFDVPGRHVVRAEFDALGWAAVRSPRVAVQVRMAGTDEERDVSVATLEPGVGVAFALGDFGRDEAAKARLVTVAEAQPESDTGGAAALVLANALARDHTDYRSGDTREADASEAKRFLDLAAQGRTAEELLALATTVPSPVERGAPVVADALARAKRARKPKADLARAEELAADFVAPSAR
ncbi:hypothetical protein [Nocardioides sp.]|uniref:hypothetical protein n=1 Tax=Nocardioides sp. TaxID=35761 RepID=UPI0035B08057